MRLLLSPGRDELRLALLGALMLTTLSLPACSGPGDDIVVMAERSVRSLDGNRPMREGGTVCVKGARGRAAVEGCWRVQALGGEGDPAQDYLIWTFRGGFRGNQRILRLTMRVQSDGAFLAGWEPKEDFEVDSPQRVKRQLVQPDQTIGYEYDALAGRIHPEPDAHLFLVSWLGPKEGVLPPRRTLAEVGSISVWAIPQGAEGFTSRVALEAVVLSS